MVKSLFASSTPDWQVNLSTSASNAVAVVPAGRVYRHHLHDGKPQFGVEVSARSVTTTRAASWSPVLFYLELFLYDVESVCVPACPVH